MLKRPSKKAVIITSSIVLTLIALVFYIWVEKDDLVKYLLEKRVSQSIGATIKLDSISISKDEILLKNFYIKANTGIYEFETSKLIIYPDLTNLFSKEERLHNIIDSLYVESPNIAYKQKFVGSSGGKSSKNKSEKSFDITNYIRKIRISNANLEADLAFKHYFRWRDKFHNANITFDRDSNYDLTCQAVATDSTTIQANVNLVQGKFTELSVDANGFSPEYIYLNALDSIKVSVIGNVKYLKVPNDKGGTDSRLEFDAFAPSASFDLFGMKIAVKNSTVIGDSDSLAIYPEESTFMGFPIEPDVALLELFDDQLLDIRADLVDADIEEQYSFLSGKISANVDISGLMSSPTIKGDLYSQKVTYQGIAVENIITSFSYYDSVKVDLKNANIGNNSISGAGFLRRNYVSANLFINNTPENRFSLKGELFSKGIILDNKPLFNLSVNNFVIGYDGFILPPVGGLIGLKENMVTFALGNNEIAFEGHSDIETGLVDVGVHFLNHSLNNSIEYLKDLPIKGFNPLLNGYGQVTILNNVIDSKFDLELTGFQDQLYIPLKADLNWDLRRNLLLLNNTTREGKIFSNESNLDVEFKVRNGDELSLNLNLDDEAIISFKDMLSSDIGIKFLMQKMTLQRIKGFFPDEIADNFPAGFVNAVVDYKYSTPQIKGSIIGTGISINNMSGLGFMTTFQGLPDDIQIEKCDLYNERQTLVKGHGNASVTDGIFISLAGAVKNLNMVDYQHILPVKGILDANLDLLFDSKNPSTNGIRLKGTGSDFTVSDFTLNDIYFNVLATPDNIHIDNLYINSLNYAELGAYGDLSYNIIKNEYIPTNHELYIKLDANVAQILMKLAPELILDGELDLNTELIIGINENGLEVKQGVLNVQDGTVVIAGQPEHVQNINITANIDSNRLNLDKFEAQIGDGFLVIENDSSQENDNFFVGELILGQFEISTSNSGIIINVPDYMPKDAQVTANLSGKYTRAATVKGPFDDMKIEGKVVVSNGSCIYPPDTENLISLITMASVNTFAKKEPVAESKDYASLPFELDSTIEIGENIRYVTYPTNILVSPKSYLDLQFKNNSWAVPSAKFVAEEGTLDFLSSDFEVEFVQIVINEFDFDISAHFIKRANDGTLVSLNASNSNPQKGNSEPFTLTLTSDNPEDKTQSQVMSRLRYNDEHDLLTATGTTNYIQNETVRMLGSNIDNNAYSVVLVPIETFLRKRLFLDYFYIKPGFIKNMLNQYVVDNVDLQDEAIYESEMAQFSSAILLNNLSINLGKELRSNLYLNYEGLFQEATDLQRRSKITYYQDFQMKYNFRFGSKISYTYKYKPLDKNSHEVMIYHSFSF